jgi:hypothetical protein
MPPKKKVVYSPGSPLHGKKLGLFFLMESTKEKIITAMKLCDMNRIGEGALYHALFKIGVHYDDATMVIQKLLADSVLYRSGCTFTLSANGKKDTHR